MRNAPGSSEAIKAGCTCPQIDNHYGDGILGIGEMFGWWMTEGCPLHGQFYRPTTTDCSSLARDGEVNVARMKGKDE